ncbi:MAG: hypothetical protein RJQ08_13660 [Salinisphaeraceae bacterium]
MSNDYFEHDTAISRNTLGRASQINNLAQAIEAGFDKLPAEADLKQGKGNYVADSGAANAYVVTLTYPPPSYSAGLTFNMKVANDNTGAATCNVNGLGVKTIKRYDGSDLDANDLVAGMIATLVYDGMYLVLTGAHGAAETNSQASATAAAGSANTAGNHASTAGGHASDAGNSASAASASAGAASGHATTSQNWATQTGSEVAGGEYSAKEQAIGSAVPTGSAKDWASKESGNVADGLKSARQYAEDAQQFSGLPDPTGNGEKFLRQKSDETGLEYAEIQLGGTLGLLHTIYAPETSDTFSENGAVFQRIGITVQYNENVTHSSLLPEAYKSPYGEQVSNASQTKFSGVYNGSEFLLVGGGTEVSKSSDGVTWTAHTGAISNCYGVIHDGSQYVAVSTGGSCMTSPDGETWTERATPFTGTDSLRAIAWNGSVYVACGYSNNEIISSTDAITWTDRTPASNGYQYGIAYGAGVFCIVGRDGNCRTSPDGITWTERTLGDSSTDFEGIAFGAGLFVAVGFNGVLYTSPDGATWTDRSIDVGGIDVFESVTWTGSEFLIGVDKQSGSETGFFRSSDGISWEEIPGLDIYTVGSNVLLSDGSNYVASASGGSIYLNNGVDEFVRIGRLESDIDNTPLFAYARVL